jgi:hypothetical protein
MLYAEREELLERARRMSDEEIEEAYWFWSDELANGGDERHCEERRSLYEQAMSERRAKPVSEGP